MRTAYAINRPVENAWLVRERDRRRMTELLVVLGIVVPLIVGLLGYTWLRHQVIAIGADTKRVEAELLERRNEERRLRLEVSRLESPARIEGVAREDLGLVPPSVEQLVFVERGAP